MNKSRKATKQLIEATNRFVLGRLTGEERAESYKSILKLVHLIVRSMGSSMASFEKMRAAKRKKNGGFRKGYLLSEKVLPIDRGVFQSKVLRDDKRDIVSGAQKWVAKSSLEGIRAIPEMLVRDNIPIIIERTARRNWEIICRKMASNEGISVRMVKRRSCPLKGYRAKIRTVKQREILTFLKAKLKEEMIEFQNAVTKEDQLEDLGDTLEVIDAYRFHLRREVNQNE